MKINLKTKSIIKKVALALAGVAALTGVGFGVKAIVDYTKNDLKTISPSFEVGNLGSDGKYVNDESTLYTKSAFACDGLQVKLDFDNEIKYQLYFYDDLDNFIESTDILSEAYSGGIHDGFARLVIIPTNDEDNKISWTEKVTYPKQMEIKVSKEQNNKYVSVSSKRLRCVDNISELRFVYGDFNTDANGIYNFIPSNKRAVNSMDLLSVKGSKKITFNDISDDYYIHFYCYEFADINGNIVCQKKNFIRDSETLELSKNTQYCLFVYAISNDSSGEVLEIPDKVLTNTFDIISISLSK